MARCFGHYDLPRSAAAGGRLAARNCTATYRDQRRQIGREGRPLHGSATPLLLLLLPLPPPLPHQLLKSRLNLTLY